MSALQIRLFGDPDVLLDGGNPAVLSSAKARALLAYLVVEFRQAHRREKLVDLLWPEYIESSARANLRRALADLRQAIEDHQADPPFLLISRESLQFNTESDAWVDTIAFISLLQPDMVGKSSNHQVNKDQIEQALAVYRAPFLDGFSIPDSSAFEEWSLITRERFHRQALQSLHCLAEAYLEDGDYERALPHAWRQVEMEPWQESGHRQVMQLLALSGQRGAALAQYEACRELLESELHTSPSEQTQQLYNLLRQGEWPSVKSDVQPRPDRVISDCPYRGLAAFQEEDAPFFFGRQEFAAHLAKVVIGPVKATVLVGPSGSGKSSLVFAGLLPLLRGEKENWLITHFRPGRNPFQSLTAALLPYLESDLSETERLNEAHKLAVALTRNEISLASVITRIIGKYPTTTCLLLLIDQFEELYTLCSESNMQHTFLDLLLETINSDSEIYSKLLITLRADFLGQALSYQPFVKLLQTNTFMLGPLTSEELREAIEKPGEKQGAGFDPGLVDRILADVGNEPGKLPLLQFAMLLLWEKQIYGWLTHDAYEAIGRVEGALTCYADQVFSDLEETSQEKMRQIFLQLINPGEGTEDTRRVATRAEIGETNWPLTRLLADKRLIVTDQEASSGNEIVEIAHEALIQKWSRLRRWMETDRAFRTWQEGLRIAQRQWQATQRDEGALLHGTPLAHAEGWLAERRSELSEVEVEYIQASKDLRDYKEREREAQRQRELTIERKTRRQLGALAGILAIAMVIALLLSVYSFQQRQQALQAYSLSVTANARKALDDGDTSTGLALALAANQIDNPPQEAQRTLLDAAYSPGPRWREETSLLFSGMKGPAVALDISPDGHTALSGFENGMLVVWDVDSKAEILRLKGHTGRVIDAAISPDGFFALSGGDDHQVIFWDLKSGQAVKYFEAHTGLVRAVDFSPDGTMAISGGSAAGGMLAPGELVLWNLETAQEIHRFTGHVSGIVAAKFTPDGKKILASSGDAEIFSDKLSGESLDLGTAPFDLILWDVASGKSVRRFEGFQDDAFSLAISPDGTRALAGSYYNNLATLWDLENGERLLTLTGHTEGVHTVDFSPDGQRALTGSYDDSLILWDLQSSQPLTVLKAHGSDVLDLVFIPNGRTALSSARDGGLILWDLIDAAQAQQIAGHGDMIYDLAFTPDGRLALSSSGSSAPSVPVIDSSIRLWDLEKGEQIKFQSIPANVIFQVTLSADGRTALLATDQPTITIWDVISWREVGHLEGHHTAVTSIEFTPDGQRALSLGVDGTLIQWDVPRRQLMRTINIPFQGLWSLSISPDGRTALTDSGNSSMILWDLETGEQLRSFVRNDPPDEPGSSGMAFTPDGYKAISCEHDGYLIEWDLESGDEIRRLGMHPSLRTRVVITSDGSLALSSGMDGSLMLWDLKSGQLVRRSSGHGIIFDLALSPDNLTALFGTSDTMIYQWRLSNPTLSELRNWIQTNRHIRNLSCDEIRMFQIEPSNDNTCDY
jgi:WD40 repeat protein/DNA-binding SARP family transcriptional activator